MFGTIHGWNALPSQPPPACSGVPVLQFCGYFVCIWCRNIRPTQIPYASQFSNFPLHQHHTHFQRQRLFASAGNTWDFSAGWRLPRSMLRSADCRCFLFHHRRRALLISNRLNGWAEPETAVTQSVKLRPPPAIRLKFFDIGKDMRKDIGKSSPDHCRRRQPSHNSLWSPLRRPVFVYPRNDRQLSYKPFGMN